MIADPFADKLNKMPSTEIKCMDRMASPQAANSRLACCVQVRPEVNEMIVIVADNRSNDGDWFQGDRVDSF